MLPLSEAIVNYANRAICEVRIAMPPAEVRCLRNLVAGALSPPASCTGVGRDLGGRFGQPSSRPIEAWLVGGGDPIFLPVQCPSYASDVLRVKLGNGVPELIVWPLSKEGLPTGSVSLRHAPGRR